MHPDPLVGHDADRPPAQPGEGGHEGLATVGLGFIHRPRVNQAPQQVTRVVFAAAAGRDQFGDPGDGKFRLRDGLRRP